MLPKTEECLKHLTNYESSRQAGIEELTATKKDIESKLALLQASKPKESDRKRQTCSKCGEPGHSARTCKQAAEKSG